MKKRKKRGNAYKGRRKSADPRNEGPSDVGVFFAHGSGGKAAPRRGLRGKRGSDLKKAAQAKVSR